MLKEIQTENSERPIVDGKQEPPQLKIEIPANRSVLRLRCDPESVADNSVDMTSFVSRASL